MKKKWMPNINGIFLCILLLGTPISLIAQTIKSDTTISKEYQLKSTYIESQYTHSNIKSSAPVQKLTKEDFLQQGITDIADALRRFSGVILKDYGGAGGMKTISIRSLGPQHTAVIYDGITSSDCQSGQIDLSRFTLDQIESLTLTVGDNADVFTPAKTFTTATSIRLQTQIPDLKNKKNQIKAALKTGSFGLINPLIRYDQRLNSKLTMSFSGDFMRADNLYPFTLINGIYSTREQRNNNYIETWRGEWNLYAKTGKRSILNTKIYYYDSFRELPGQVILYNPTNQEQLSNQNFFSQFYFRTFWDCNLSLQINGKFNWDYSHYHDEAPEYPNGKMDNTYHQREYYNSACLLYTPLSDWTFALATDYAYNNLNSNALSNTKPNRHSILQSFTIRYRTPHFTATTTLLSSFYLNKTNTKEAANNIQRLSPSFSIAWQPIEEKEFYLRVSYKDIFRVPTFTENYFNLWGSKNLKPETTRQYNLGFTYEKNNSLGRFYFQGTIDGYYNQVKNKIVAMPYNMFFWTMINLGEVEIIGTDITTKSAWQLTPSHRLLATLSYSYQQAIDKTDPNTSYYKDQIPYTPKHSGSFSLNWENQWLNLACHATGTDIRYSSMENTKANEIKGYLECGLALYRSFSWQGKQWTIRGDLINLTDKQYDIVKNYPMPGRSYKLTLNVIL